MLVKVLQPAITASCPPSLDNVQGGERLSAALPDGRTPVSLCMKFGWAWISPRQQQLKTSWTTSRRSCGSVRSSSSGSFHWIWLGKAWNIPNELGRGLSATQWHAGSCVLKREREFQCHSQCQGYPLKPGWTQNFQLKKRNTGPFFFIWKHNSCMLDLGNMWRLGAHVTFQEIL